VRRLLFAIAVALLAASPTLMASEPAPTPACCSAESMDNASETSELSPVPKQKENVRVKFVIKKLSVPHCKRGPERCELCKKNSEPRWRLLDVDPPDKEMLQRPVIELSIDGERHFLVYDVIKSFASEEEARQFEKTSNLHDIHFDDQP